MIFNIAELLWKQLLLKYWLQDTTISFLTYSEVKKLYTLLKHKDKALLLTEAASLFYQICKDIHINDITSITYFKQGLTSLTSQIYLGLQQQTLIKEISYHPTNRL